MSAFKKAVVLAAAASLMLACSGSSKPKGSGSKTPTVKLIDKSAADILAAATAATTAKGSVHIVITSKQGNRTGTIVNDTGAASGRQVITLGSQHIEIRLVDNIAYVYANEAALKDFFQFPAALAKKYANKWLSFSSTDRGFDEISDTLDMPTLVNTLTLTGALTKTGVTTVNGTEVIGIRGTDKQGGAATLYIATTGEPLPVQLVSTNEGETDTGVFSKWGEAVDVKAPSGAVSVSAATA
jgi:hypothetical protein